MAKTYAQSVKLPNLVAVAHPSTKFLSRDGLNVEGRSSANAGAATSSSNYALNRKDYIKSLMGGDSAKSKAKGRDGILVNTDQIMESIDEKLTTGYHGVKHLFRTNDPSQSGQLSKETFRCILNQLCGYISSEAWNRLIPRFGLDLKDSISFDEFIMHFEDNPKVKKELSATNTSVELVNLAQPTLLMMDMKAKKSQTTPSLSAAYCFALMKAKARSMDFEPREYLPEECFENRGLVMPYHLTDLLNAWDLPLSPNEFQKLWERFDLKNIGGVKTRVFLRLIDYNSNEIEHLTQQTAMLRTKSCIVEKPHQRHASDPSLSQLVKSLSSSVEEKRNEKNAATTFSVDTATNSSSYLKQIIEYDPLESEAVPFDNKFLKKVDQEAEKVLTKEKEAAAAADAKKKAEAEAQKKRVQSTLSESRIKSMAQFLKNSSKFGPNEDLVVFINNKLNHGYISFKTAFEYVDPDHLGHLLKDEFLIVLREFAINFDHESYDAFLKKHSLIKHNQLVDYQKFLQIFQSLGESSLTMAYLKAKAADAKSATNSQLKQAELNLIEFFHDFYFVLLNFFKEKIGDSSPTSTCTVDFFKRLLEQKLVILMDKSQLDSLLHFINQYDEVQKSNGQVNWMALFKKFAEIDPWQCFKDSCENAMNNLKPFYARRTNEPKTGGSPQVVVKSFDTLKPPKRTKSPATPPKPAATVQVDSSAELAALSSSDEDDDDEIKNLDTPRESAAATTTNRLLRSSTIGASSVKMKNTFDTLRLNYLEKSVELLFRTKFHSINKYFTLLDPGHTEKLDKEKFRLLMLKSGLKLNSTDVILLWRDFDAETIPFSNLVRRFFRPDEFNRLRNIKDKIRLDKRIKEYDAADQTQKSRSSVERASQLFSSLASRSFTAEKTTKSVVQEKKMDIELISKAKPFVLERWSELKRDFQQMDKLSSTHCPNTRAVEIFKKNRINLPEKDLFELCKHFSFNESASDLDYIKFLKYFNASAASYSQTKLNAPKWKNLNPTLRKIILKLRELNSNRTSETNPLVFDLNNLRITFKKFDPVRKGHLTSAEFKDLLKMCSLSVNLDEMYMMFSEYDPDLKGVFNYDLFIKSLIDKSLTSD